MSEAKHTASPWGDISGQGKMRSIRAQGKTIAEAVAGDSIEEIEANARLIAAAPDLLTACKAIMNAETRKQHELAVREVEKAIAKAEGRS